MSQIVMLIIISLLSLARGSVDFSETQLQHYWNLFKLKDVYVSAKLNLSTNGILFVSKHDDKKFEIGVHKMVLQLIIPENQKLHRRIVIKLQNETEVDIMIVLNENDVLVFDGCNQIYSDQMTTMNLKFSNPTIQVLPHWIGKKPKVEIGSGFPIRQKCKSISNFGAQSYVEEVENTHKMNHTTPIINFSTFYNDARLPPKHFEGCLIDNVLVIVGESRNTNCTKCTCIARDRVVCQAENCKHLQCENPIFRQGDCCPSCAKSCWFQDQLTLHPHSEIFWPAECYRCECWDGEVKCNNINLPCKTPNCPARDWILDKKYECCPKCRDNANFCEIKPCHEYADCYNEKHHPKCVCKEGFYGNGTFCVDIDECKFSEDARQQLGGCLDGTQCINKMGSFECSCLPGFQRLTEQICIPLLRV